MVACSTDSLGTKRTVTHHMPRELRQFVMAPDSRSWTLGLLKALTALTDVSTYVSAPEYLQEPRPYNRHATGHYRPY